MQINLKQWLLFYGLIFTLIFFVYSDYSHIKNPVLRVNYLDIGQGDATLIISPTNQKILIDAGPPGKIGQNLKQYFSFFDKKIDLFILTHPDSDHIGGLLDILKNCSIQQIALPQDTQNKAEFNSLMQFIQAKNIPIIFPNQTTDLKLGEDLLVDFIYPTKKTSNSTQNQASNSSLVCKIIYHNTTFLFSGDAPIKEEKQILLSGQNLNADIYQVGHHGSKTSSSKEFLQSILPSFSIISAAQNNSFGHPHQEILDALQKIHSTILQTPQQGNIEFYSDGVNLLFSKN